jgi:hypothetical protein
MAAKKKVKKARRPTVGLTLEEALTFLAGKTIHAVDHVTKEHFLVQDRLNDIGLGKIPGNDGHGYVTCPKDPYVHNDCVRFVDIIFSSAKIQIPVAGALAFYAIK